jgi:hypothetical protein
MLMANGLSSDKLPHIFIESSKLLLYGEICVGVGNRGRDFQPVPDNSRIMEKPIDVPQGERCDNRRTALPPDLPWRIGASYVLINDVWIFVRLRSCSNPQSGVWALFNSILPQTISFYLPTASGFPLLS